MTSLNSNHIIIEAKNQYTTQLIDTIAPFIFSGLRSVYTKCDSLKQFQEELCHIPKWNQLIIDNEYDRVVKYSKCDWLDKLIESVFVCNVKILSAINPNNTNVFKLKIPDTKSFIHACYIESARNLYTDPYLISDEQEHYPNKNMKECIGTIGKSIEKTIYHFIPKQEIIEQCLNEYKNDETPSEDEQSDKSNSYASDEDEENTEEETNENEEDDENYKTLNDQRADILMHEPTEENVGTPDLDITNTAPFKLPEDVSEDKETIQIPVNLNRTPPEHRQDQNQGNQDQTADYFFSSDED